MKGYSLDNEINISNLIKTKVPNYKDYFAIVENNSSINVEKIKDKRSCSLISDYKSSNFMLLNIEYVGIHNYREYLMNQKNNKNIIEKN